MIIIYFLKTGEIHECGIGWKTIEEFYGHRAEEMKKIFGFIYLEYDNFVYNNFFRFRVDTKTQKLILEKPPEYLSNYINK